CRHNYLFAGKRESDEAPARRFTVKEVMTDRVESFEDGDDLNTLIEGLSQYRFGAVLIKDASGRAVGIVSKTDLIVAYRHGLSPDTKAKDIMSQGVRACQKDAYLAEAIQQMILSDVLRLFVYEKEPDQIVGVLSFTDAARIRSGSCSACLASRIKIDDEAP
ncbi:MAG: CBS domain-containing protein, partial [Deltaproteobacteria bacterium]|nr:CBS domain-containing protein [Deltaproteobacteria bacterium]